MKNETLAIYTMVFLLSLGTAMAVVGVKSTAKTPDIKGPRYGSIVRLVREGHTFCSCVLISNDTILTAGHCAVIETPFGMFMNPDPIEIRQSNNKPIGITATVKSASSQIDRGILKGDFSRLEKSTYISDTTKSIDTRVLGRQYISCGYPLGGELYCQLTHFVSNLGFFIAVKGKGNLIPGMSGGPTMLEDGTVIAINVAVDNEFNLLSPSYEVDGQK